MSSTVIHRWILDVELLWPTTTPDPDPPAPDLSLTRLWQLEDSVQQTLTYLSEKEKTNVLRMHFTKDAKLALASCLLKRRAITEICRVPWARAIVGADSNLKPCYKPGDDARSTLEFNISHHGTLVPLVACEGTSTQLGVDVVSIDWERSYAAVTRSGFTSWARVYEEVFSKQEVQDIIDFAPEGDLDDRSRIMAKIRHFYAHWCFKEAYVKMTGEALGAPFLKDLVFRHVHTPSSARQLGMPGEWGETISDTEIWLYGEQVKDVTMEIQAFRDDYMIAVAASNLSVSLLPYRLLDLHKDVLP